MTSDTEATQTTGRSSFLQVMVWHRTRERPVSDDFAVEIVGHEIWKPDRSRAELEHTFHGLVEAQPYTLRVSGYSPDEAEITQQFWTPRSRSTDQYLVNYLIEITDDEIAIRGSGYHSTGIRKARPGDTPALSRANAFWQRCGLKLVGGIFILLIAVAYLVSYLADDEGSAATSTLDPSTTVTVSWSATMGGGADEMQVNVLNEYGGIEEHIVTGETWQASGTVLASAVQWIYVTNRSQTGDVRCEMRVNGRVWVEATSTGPGVTASCEGVPSEFSVTR